MAVHTHRHQAAAAGAVASQRSISDATVGGVHVTFLTQVGAVGHGQTRTPEQDAQAIHVAGMLADFIDAAKFSLHMAIYDFRLDGEAARRVAAALNARAQAGVTVRIAFFAPPGQPDPAAFALLGSDPAPLAGDVILAGQQLHERVQRRAVKPDPSLPPIAPPVTGERIQAPHNLMHEKYVVRDGITPTAAVWTGSANFTMDAFSLQENNILVMESCPALARSFETDFGQMWDSGVIARSGDFDSGPLSVGATPLSVLFAPGRGRQIGADIAARIATAERRLLLASMLISSGPILGAIADRMHRVEEFGGIFDGSQMHAILAEWHKAGTAGPASKRAGASTGKAMQFEHLAPFLHYKPSVPYHPDQPHNFMHDKVAVVDDAVITGSFNFSVNAQRNAENALVIEDAALADRYAEHIRGLMAMYPKTGIPA